MNGPPIRYRAEPPSPLQPPTPPTGEGGSNSWIKWVAGGLLVVVLLLAAAWATGGSDNPAPVKKKAEKPVVVKPVAKPNSWRRSYDASFSFASNPGGQPVTVQSVAVTGLNRSKAKIVYQVTAGCSAPFTEKRRWELLTYITTGRKGYPSRIGKQVVVGATCQWTVQFNWPSSWVVAPKATDFWIHIPRGKGPSNTVAVRLSVPASHRGL